RVDVWIPVAITNAYVRARAGQTKEAVADLAGVLNAYGRAQEVNYHMARIYAMSGDVDNAISSYRTVLRAINVIGYTPVEPAMRTELGELLAKKGDAAGAKEQFDALLKQWAKADTEFNWLKKIRDERRALDSK